MHNRDKFRAAITQLSSLELPPVLSNVGATGVSLLGKHEELNGPVTGGEWFSSPPVAQGSGILAKSHGKSFSEMHTRTSDFYLSGIKSLSFQGPLSLSPAITEVQL